MNRFFLQAIASFFGLVLVVPTSFAAPKECVSAREGLDRIMHKATGGKSFQENWIETTADDGKPLKIEMATRSSKLYFVFDKTKEGIWAEGPVTVCVDGSDFLVKLGGDSIKVGDAAPRIVKWSMSGGATFRLKLKDPAHLHVSTTGWSGDFVPSDAKASLVKK